jgi:putative aldouronate transport system permease protein
MLVPGIIYFVVFRYLPMGGLLMAFENYNIFKGMWGSEWVGLANFKTIFGSTDFYQVLTNTFLISLYKLIFGFPVPIALAILLNELRLSIFNRVVQSVLYLPHFISWVVIGGIMLTLLSPQYGVIGHITNLFGDGKLNLLTSREYFRSILVVSDIWKSAGWGTIIYMAALTQVDPSLYEAAVVDGAGKWAQIWYVTIPSIMNVIMLLLILEIGRLMNAGFEQILVLQNPLVRDISDVFETYVYDHGIQRGDYSLAATVDFFKSTIAFVLVVTAHQISKKLGHEGVM